MIRITFSVNLMLEMHHFQVVLPKGIRPRSNHRQGVWGSGKGDTRYLPLVRLRVQLRLPTSRGPLALRLGVPLIRRRPLFQVVIPVFVRRVLDRPENPGACHNTHTHTQIATKQLHGKNLYVISPQVK